jgi:NTP pyrophosphatase (non-canonical NTP hydrolase)
MADIETFSQSDIREILGFSSRDTPSLNLLQVECHNCAVDNGWWDEPREIGTQIALMHSELSEALEAAREGNFEGKDGVVEELADTIIRILDTCGQYSWDLEATLLRKMAYNRGREYRHGNKEF